MSELDLKATPGVEINFPYENDIMNFNVTVVPEFGLYKKAKFLFELSVPQDYPYSAPKAICKTKIYHPNIDLDGHVCLNILRADWKPVLTMGAVLIGLLHLFQEPNPNDPLNKDAANEMLKNPEGFERNVYRTLRGGFFFGKNFEKLL